MRRAHTQPSFVRRRGRGHGAPHRQAGRDDAPWKGDTLTSHDCVVTDDAAQAVTEKLTYPKPYHGEVSDLVSGKLPGRKDARQRTALVFSGIGLADVAVGGVVYEAARAKGIGRVLTL